jgi:acyl-CoA thioesterase I
MVRWSIAALLLSIAAPASASPERPLVLAFGDSLTAGYQLDPGLGFAGVAGNAAGRARLAWTLDGLSEKPDLVIVELGANDMLRSLDPTETERNLDAILGELRRRGIPVLLAGMRAARNADPAYIRRFEAIFPALAARHGAAYYPFFLDGVAAVDGMTLPDRMHPNFRGVKTIVTRIVGPVKAALGR